ncbi:MAG: hypothetical protein K0R38_7679 [Polyangiaceae bacterium]|nr:hypothetical protein [Polyangiaceae bacterium]
MAGPRVSAAAGAVSAAGWTTAAGVGGNEPGPRGEGGAAALASEGGGGGFSSGGSEDCPSVPLSCSGSRDSVNVNGVELSFPGAGSCGVCTATCVECERDGRGTCLNTTSSEPYYVDDAGKRWSVVTLSADRAMDFTQVGLVQSSLSLTITDGSATRVLPVLVHACNPERLCFLPC